MPDLLLPSLEIQNFRAFEHLRIERLGRVNLITGKNNVGKTSLLEAVYLYARGGNPHILQELLRGRDELRKRSTGLDFLDKNVDDYNQVFDEDYEHALDVRYLFYGRKAVKHMSQMITIGASHGQAKKMSVKLLADQPDTPDGLPRIETVSNSGVVSNYSADRLSSIRVPYKVPSGGINCQFLKAQTLSALSLGRIWDKIVVANQRGIVYDVLRIIAPGIQEIDFINEGDDSGQRVAVIKTVNLNESIPLRSFGEGMNHLFGLAVMLTAAKDGILLIDEVETGLHYSVMPDVWHLIFEVAQRLNVQVFATTHSWDCIEAFQQAASEDEHEEAELIRLANHDGNVSATVFDERKLNIATRELIEVR